MRLRKRILLIALSGAAALGLALLLVSHAILEESYVRLEAEFALQDLARVRRAISGQLDGMARTARDWGQWTDTFEFVRTRDQAYIDGNLAPPQIANLDLNCMAFFDQAGELVHAAVIDIATGEPRPFPAEIKAQLKPGGLFAPQPGSPSAGLLMLASGAPALAAAHPVLPNDGQGPANGRILLLRMLDPERVGRIASDLDLKLEISLLCRDSGDAADQQPAIAEQEGAHVFAIADDRIEAHDCYADAAAKPAFEISITKDCAVVAQGRSTVLAFILVLLVAFAAIGLIALWAADRVVFSRIVGLTQRVLALSRSPRPGARLPEQGSDEIAALARGINLMLVAREDSEQALISSERLAAVGTLASGVAHEFNNINCVVLGYTELCLQKDPGPDLERKLQTVREAALRARAITQNLLSFSGQSARISMAADLASVARNTVSLIRSEYESTGIIFDLRLDPAPLATMDPGQISQVIINLLTNACHALIDRQEPRIRVQTGHDDRQVWVEVADTGCGIPEEDLIRIFSPFFTTKGEHAASGSPQAQVRGTGLGLSISHTIAANHSGTLTVQSRPGAGATFRLSLPRQKGGAQTAAPAPAAFPPIRGNGETILVLDDEKDVGEFLVLALRRAGFQARAMEDGNRALQALQETAADLVIVDLQMPIMDGIQFLENLRQIGLARQPGVIVFTGRTADLHAEKLASLGVATILCKPVEIQVLLQSVSQTLQAARP